LSDKETILFALSKEHVLSSHRCSRIHILHVKCKIIGKVKMETTAED